MWEKLLLSGPRLLIRRGTWSAIEQVQFEEAFFRFANHRASNVGLLLVNEQFEGKPSIVVGLSGVVDELVKVENAERDGVLLIRRFSAGGTVVLSSPATFGVSLILPKKMLPCAPFPRAIVEWSANVYSGAFLRGKFRAEEADYVAAVGPEGEWRKVGGNAQAISRWYCVHHTSFLWNPDEAVMDKYLLLPKRQPKYRQSRPHGAFVGGLASLEGGSREEVINEVIAVTAEYFARRGVPVSSGPLPDDAGELWQQAVEKFPEHMVTQVLPYR